MAAYEVRVLHGGEPVEGVEVVGGEVLYSAGTGADGKARVVIAGRNSPVVLHVVLVKADLGLPWLTIPGNVPTADRERRTAGGFVVQQSVEPSKRRQTTRQEQIESPTGDATTWQDGYDYGPEGAEDRYGRPNPDYAPGFQFGGGPFVLRPDVTLDIVV